MQNIFINAIKGDSCWKQVLEEIKKIYGEDFQHSSLESQLSLLQQTAKSMDYDIKQFNIKDLVSLFQRMDHSTKVLLAELVKLVNHLLVMPSTNEMREQSFSAVKCVNTCQSSHDIAYS